MVDDDAALRQLMALVCRRAGFDVDMAADGGEALRLIEQQDYVVVTLDLQMPNVNGYDVVKRLRSRSRRPSIIVLTALPPHAYSGLDAGVVQAIIRKPFDVDLLTTMINELAEIAREEWQDSGSSDNVVDFRQ